MKRWKSWLFGMGFVALAAIALPGCSGPQQHRNDLQSFTSIDEAYAAVDNVLGCDSSPVGNPIVPMGDGGKLTTAQRLCFDNVQIDLYPDQKALEASYTTLSDSSQGEIDLVRGGNWMVVDFSRVATGQPSNLNIKDLAGKLDGEYSVVGS